MEIVDAQIHLWGTACQATCRIDRLTAFAPEEAIALMDEGGVDAAIIHPPGWDPGFDRHAFEAVRNYPGPLRDHGLGAARSTGISRAHRKLREQPGMLGLR